ncbi:MAG: fasciclin domain-containing protein [Rufibacter sp.]
MERKLHYVKVSLVLSLCLVFQIQTYAQSFLAAGTSASTKAARMSVGEGLAAHNQQELLELVTKAGLMPLLSNGEAYTFFTPSAEALAKYQGEAPETIKAFLSKHIVKGALTTADLKDGSDIRTIDGSKLRICRKKGAVIVDGVRLQTTDQVFSNGVMHQLKGAFQPSSATASNF